LKQQCDINEVLQVRGKYIAGNMNLTTK